MSDEPRKPVTTVDDVRPLGLGGRLDLVALARVWAKVAKHVVPAIIATAAALAAGVPVVVSSYRDAVAKAEQKAAEAKAVGKQAKSSSEATYQVVTKPKIEELEARVRALELASARAQPKPGKRMKRPIPVVVAPKPIPLPRDTNAAEHLLAKQVAAPVPRLVPDAGAPP